MAAAADLKQIIILRTDLGMGKGKMVAQGCHASVLATLDAQKHNPIWYRIWMAAGMKKIAVKVASEEELLLLFKKARDAKLPTALINDAGHTQLPPGTATAVGIGPAPSNLVDPITANLKLL